MWRPTDQLLHILTVHCTLLNNFIQVKVFTGIGGLFIVSLMIKQLIPSQRLKSGWSRIERTSYLLFVQIWGNSWELNHDPNLWDDPWTFKPERYLDEEGHLVTADHPNRRCVASNWSELSSRFHILQWEVKITQRFHLLKPCSSRLITPPNQPPNQLQCFVI